MQTKHGYFPLLDSFRAISVILILLFHGMPTVFPFGWIGVSMFFVLSGFLITGILRKNTESHNYFKAFYFRRILRIFPIYYLVLLFCTGWSLYLKLDLSQFLYYVFFLQSFSLSEGLQPVFSNELMAHTWSLSVEEIFYFIWPAIVYFFKRRVVQIFCFGLIAFSFLYKLIQYRLDNELLAGYSLFSNLDSLMFGALLAIYLENKTANFSFKSSILTGLLFLFNLIMIYSLYFSADPDILHYSKLGLTLGVSIFSYYFLLLLVSPVRSNILTRVLSRIEIVFVGKISYGLYLYHFPIYNFVQSYLYHYKFSLNSISEMLLKIAVTFIAAVFSWNLIEKPILKMKHKLVY